MSIFDKAVAAITPPESEKDRAEARAKAQECAQGAGWFSDILGHHLEIEDAFAQVKSASDATARTEALKALAEVLTAHAIAEEAVIYPALGQEHEKGHATMGYTEQAAVKMQMAKLEVMDPLSQDFLDKLEHVRGAVAHHMYEEEGTWFIELAEKADAAEQDRLTARYEEEFERYMSGGDFIDDEDDADLDEGEYVAAGEPRSFTTPSGL